MPILWLLNLNFFFSFVVRREIREVLWATGKFWKRGLWWGEKNHTSTDKAIEGVIVSLIETQVSEPNIMLHLSFKDVKMWEKSVS